MIFSTYSETNTYLPVTSQNEKTTLLGKTKQDYASILRWMSFANTELLPKLGAWFRPLIGRDPYNKKTVDDGRTGTDANIAVFEEHLTANTYLVGERLTLADLFAAGLIARGFEFFFDKAWRDEHPATTRWYETVTNQDIYKSAAGEPKLIETSIPQTAPKKEKSEEKPKEQKPKAEKAAPKPKAAAKEVDDDDEDDAPAAPKAKHPLEGLPKATFVLDDWYVGSPPIASISH